MQPFKLDNEEASIVLVGSLNPAIFHPEWLLRHGLIAKDDLDGADVDIVHRDLAKFSLDWLKIDVTRDKLIARTNDPSKYEPLGDLMISVLKILEHMPILQMGMNRKLRYIIEKEELWHKIGDNLAPKKYWDILPERAGLKQMHIEYQRIDDLEGKLNFVVRPVLSEDCTVFFDVNSHIELQIKKDDKETNIDAEPIINDQWEKSLEFAIKSCENILIRAMEL